MFQRDNLKHCVRIAVLGASLLWGLAVFGVGPQEVIVWEHSGYGGDHLSWTLEPHMRHRLVSALPGWANDMISSLEVGAAVKVAVYRHSSFAGPSTIYSGETAYVGDYWNDEISSLIVFPADLVDPLGVLLSEVGFATVTGYERTIQFFPLPELLQETEALYPTLGDYINDEAGHMLIQGSDIEAEVFEHANFQGAWWLRFPGDHCVASSLYSWRGYQAVRLGGCRAGLSGSASSLKVRWTGLPLLMLQGHVIEPVPDISGTWQSTFQLVYEISQSGNQFTWYVAAFHEAGTGTIDGTHIEVSWQGDNGSGHDAGTIILNSEGEPIRIEWGHGNVFYR
jgi:hypothetical protein